MTRGRFAALAALSLVTAAGRADAIEIAGSQDFVATGSLEQRVRANGSSSVLTVTFTTPVTDAGATVTVVAAGNRNPGIEAYDAVGASLGSWGASPAEGLPLYMGFQDALPPEPGIVRLLSATSAGGSGAERVRVDDLVFAPEPAVAAASVPLTAWQRRRR